jgi:hypothetical protein
MLAVAVEDQQVEAQDKDNMVFLEQEQQVAPKEAMELMVQVQAVEVEVTLQMVQEALAVLE